jgi:putative hydrolase of HD superfamily
MLTEGYTWRNAATPVTKVQVEKRMACIKEFMPQVYIWVDKSIAFAVKQGWLS